MLTQLNWLDYCLLGLICFSSFIGFARGLVQELSSLANWVLGVWSGFIFYDIVADYLPEIVQPAKIRYLVGFFLVFSLILIAVTILGKSIKWLVVSTGLSGPDGILGVIFGGLRGVAFVLLFLVVMRPSFEGLTAWQTSQLIPYFDPLEHWVIGNYSLQF